ncbi:glycosyltransferase [Cellulosimicrobium sp. NPDC057127]|uniref:glycosyltransferase n=1 Tax=Cellulosimicrobium sp. NPDC057127 TaxID=3346026 RepID=UPI00363F9DDB
MQSGTAQPHLLYIAWGYPPARGSGVYRALATPNAFAREGWQVTVLTADEESFGNYTGADRSLLEYIDPAIEVVRIPFVRETTDPRIHRWSRARIEAPNLWMGLQNTKAMLQFPEPKYGQWRPALERAVRDIHRRKPVDLSIATANPHVDFVAAYALGQVGVPYVMDYRDAWQLDVFSGNRLTRPHSRVARWERRMVGDAHEVWFVNEPIAAWHRDLYPDAANRMFVVPNGHDGSVRPSGAVPPGDGEPLRFGYIGTVSSRVPVTEFIAGWRRARTRQNVLAGATADVYGYVGFDDAPSQQRTLLAEAEAEGEQLGVRFRGPVRKSDVSATYASFDALLLILGTGRYVTSGKVFEYLATGLPIVSVHDPTNAASEVLQDYPLWFPAASLSADDIADALARAAQEIRTPDERRWEDAATWHHRTAREAVLAPRIEALRKAVAR